MNMMNLDVFFLEIMRMSWLTSILVIFVLLVRLSMNRLPKAFSYLLWSAVWIRAVLPLNIKSPLSLFNILKTAGQKLFVGQSVEPGSFAMVDGAMGSFDVPYDTTTFIDRLEKLPGMAPSEIASVDPLQVYVTFGSMIWLIGIVVLILFSVRSYYKVLKLTGDAVETDGRIHFTDSIDTPFIIGMLRPRIMIPNGLTAEEKRYVLAHERKHLSRGDHLIKPLVFAICVLHWFNPLIWVAFRFTARDMEMSCDESVVRRMDMTERADYSQTLLSFSNVSYRYNALAFGESDVKKRIVSILKYKKPKPLIVIVSVLLICILLVAMLTSPNKFEKSGVIVNSGEEPIGGDISTIVRLYDMQRLYDSRTPYVGNNSKVSSAVYAVPWPKGTHANGIALHTDHEPYGLTVNLIVDKDADLQGVYGNESTAIVRANAAAFFAIIDNMSYININYKREGTGEAGTITPESGLDILKLDRAELEKVVGGDLKSFGESKDSLEKLIQDMLALIKP